MTPDGLTSKGSSALLISRGLAEYIDEINELVAHQTDPAVQRRGVGEFGSLPLNEVVINGNDLISDDFILNELSFPKGFY